MQVIQQTNARKLPNRDFQDMLKLIGEFGPLSRVQRSECRANIDTSSVKVLPGVHSIGATLSLCGSDEIETMLRFTVGETDMYAWRKISDGLTALAGPKLAYCSTDELEVWQLSDEFGAFATKLGVVPYMFVFVFRGPATAIEGCKTTRR